MANQITVTVQQQSLTTSQGSARNHTVLVDRPESKGGTDLGMMGGEMLLVALGGCFMSNLLEAVRTREAAIRNIQTDIIGTLEGSPAAYTAIEMRIRAEYDDAALFQKLVTIAERSCICANTLRQGLPISIVIA